MTDVYQIFEISTCYQDSIVMTIHGLDDVITRGVE